MKRRDFVAAAGSVGLFPFSKIMAAPCPPPNFGVPGGSSATSNCGVSTGTYLWNSNAQYDKTSFGKYVVRNNYWAPFENGASNPSNPGAGQITRANNEQDWVVEANPGHFNGAGNVKTYPSVVRGWSRSEGDAMFLPLNAGLGIQLSNLTKCRMRWGLEIDANAPPTRVNCLQDIYLHTAQNPVGATEADVNVLVNQYCIDPAAVAWYASIYNGTGGFDVKTMTLGGLQWRVGVQNPPKFTKRPEIFLFPVTVPISPKPEKFGLTDLQYDLRAVLLDLASSDQVINGIALKDIVQTSLYLTSIQCGFEIIEGGANGTKFRTKAFWTAVQNEADGASA